LKTFRIDHILSPTREMKQIDGRRVLSPTACISLDDNMTQIVSRTLKAEAVGVSVRIFIFFTRQCISACVWIHVSIGCL